MLPFRIGEPVLGTHTMATQGPSLSDYFQAASAVNQLNGLPTAGSGLTRLEFSDLQYLPQGFFAEAFLDSTHTKIIVSFEASILDPANPLYNTPYGQAAFAADKNILLGLEPTQIFDDAAEFVEKVQSDYRFLPVYVTGHSLGGAEAEYAASAASSTVRGGATFGAPGMPRFSVNQNAPASASFTNYIDVADPVGNYAADPYSGLSNIAEEGFLRPEGSHSSGKHTIQPSSGEFHTISGFSASRSGRRDTDR